MKKKKRLTVSEDHQTLSLCKTERSKDLRRLSRLEEDFYYVERC